MARSPWPYITIAQADASYARGGQVTVLDVNHAGYVPGGEAAGRPDIDYPAAPVHQGAEISPSRTSCIGSAVRPQPSAGSAVPYATAPELVRD